LGKQAIRSQITKETYKEFKNRVIFTILSLPLEVINKTIASMPNRVKEIIKREGQCLRY
jgi:hypothetical protein